MVSLAPGATVTVFTTVLASITNEPVAVTVISLPAERTKPDIFVFAPETIPVEYIVNGVADELA